MPHLFKAPDARGVQARGMVSKLEKEGKWDENISVHRTGEAG